MIPIAGSEPQPSTIPLARESFYPTSSDPSFFLSQLKPFPEIPKLPIKDLSNLFIFNAPLYFSFSDSSFELQAKSRKTASNKTSKPKSHLSIQAESRDEILPSSTNSPDLPTSESEPNSTEFVTSGPSQPDPEPDRSDGLKHQQESPERRQDLAREEGESGLQVLNLTADSAEMRASNPGRSDPGLLLAEYFR